MKISKKQLRGIVTEEVAKLLSEVLLNEDAESNGQEAFRKALKAHGLSDSEMQQKYKELCEKIPNIRAPFYTNTNGRRKGTYKWASAIVRMYYNNEITNFHILDDILKFISDNKKLSEFYDNNLNGETFEQLSTNFLPLINKKNAEEKNNSNRQNDVSAESEYRVVRIPDFETAAKYSKYMGPVKGWCITHYKRMWDNYTFDNNGLFYFFLKNGFENIPPVKGENCPLDEYGLSMIAVLVPYDGSISKIVCRWNCENGGTENVMTVNELQKITKLNPFQVCPPFSAEELEAKGAETTETLLRKIKKGARPEDVFEYYFADGDNSDILYVYFLKKWRLYRRDKNQFIKNNAYLKGIAKPKNLIIPEKVTDIYDEFEDMKSLTSITISDNVKSIEEFSFGGCIGLTSIKLPQKLEYIQEWTFEGCEGLTTITIPSNVVLVKKGAFFNCKNLKTAYITSRKTKVLNDSFPSTTKVIYPDDNKGGGENAQEEQLSEVREKFNNLLKRMDGLMNED